MGRVCRARPGGQRGSEMQVNLLRRTGWPTVLPGVYETPAALYTASRFKGQCSCHSLRWQCAAQLVIQLVLCRQESEREHFGTQGRGIARRVFGL